METSAKHHLPTMSTELMSVNFDDRRLNQRLRDAADAMAETPSASLPAIFHQGKDIEGFYRLLRNKRVTMERVLSPHHETTCERAQNEGTILALHDTTEFSFAGETEREGLGAVQGGQGFFAHVALAVTADDQRRPLGVLGLVPLVRKRKPKRAAKNQGAAATQVAKKPTPRELYARPDKESLRWRQLVEQVEAQLAGRAEVIHVMDREADDYDLLYMLVSSRRFVVRLKHNRTLAPDELGLPPRKVQDALASAAPRLERLVKLSPRRNDTKAPKARRVHPTRGARLATLHVSATRVTIQRPQRLPTTLPATLTLNVVHVQEVGAPDDEMPVSWVLFTNEPIATKEEIARVVDIYRARWVIEDYFMALKTGCAFEKRQLESKTTLLNLLAIFVPIAWRLLLLRSLARDDPDAPAVYALPPPQLEVLEVISRKKLPDNATVRDVYLAIAALGGHIKSNCSPGWRVLFRGYERLRAFEQGWLAARATVDQSSRQSAIGKALRSDQ
jgi:hypothetical protein